MSATQTRYVTHTEQDRAKKLLTVVAPLGSVLLHLQVEFPFASVMHVPCAPQFGQATSQNAPVKPNRPAAVAVQEQYASVSPSPELKPYSKLVLNRPPTVV